MANKNSHKKKVLLFIPNTRWMGMRPWFVIPFGISILTSILKEKYNVSVIDANGKDLCAEDCKLLLDKIAPDAVLISGITAVEYPPQIHYAMELIKSTCPEAVTVLGGPYPTVMPAEVIKDENIDYVFFGHAEERIIDFLELVFKKDTVKLKNFAGIGFRCASLETIINPVKSYIGDVKNLVKPYYDLIDLKPYLTEETFVGDTHSQSNRLSASIITSYGCPYNCVFCATRTISGRKVAFRPMDDVFEEIDYFYEKYKIQHLIILDDNFLVRSARVIDLCNAMIEKRWGEMTWKFVGAAAWLLNDDLLRLLKKSRCVKLRISPESGSPRVLKEIIRKPLDLKVVPDLIRKCRDLGIYTRGQFVIGFPGETWEEIRQTFRFAEECNFDLVHFSIATPFPKTDLYKLARKGGYLPTNFSFINANYNGWGQAFISTEEFTTEELMILRSFEWDRINFSTKEKIERAAKLYNMTVEQLNEHRKNTRKNTFLKIKMNITE